MKKNLILILLTCLALVAASCGESTDPETSPTTIATTRPVTQETTERTYTLTHQTPEPTPADSELPDVDLIRVSTGDTVRLSSLTPAATPLLLWFWAPH